MSFTWSFKAFAHYIVNPPTMQSGCDISLTLINNVGVFQLTKQGVGSQTEYAIVVSNPTKLGVNNSEQMTINRVSQDLILACGLILRRSALSIFRSDASKPDVIMIPIPAKTIVKDTPTGKSIEIHETLTMRDEVYVTVGTKEELDECEVVKLVMQLNKIQRFNLDSGYSLRKANLINALHEYEAAMASFDRLMIFKHLYNVLEIVTNIDGINREGSALDTQMALITGVPQSQCEECRSLYNRTKHIYRNTADVATFVTRTEKVTDYIQIARTAAGNELTKLLISI